MKLANQDVHLNFEIIISVLSSSNKCRILIFKIENQIENWTYLKFGNKQHIDNQKNDDQIEAGCVVFDAFAGTGYINQIAGDDSGYAPS